VSGVEGLFRSTSENVMHVLRDNKESLMAMLEAFVHDPLINWRLLDLNSSTDTKQNTASKPTTTAPGMLPTLISNDKEETEFPTVSPQALNQVIATIVLFVISPVTDGLIYIREPSRLLIESNASSLVVTSSSRLQWTFQIKFAVSLRFVLSCSLHSIR